MARIRRVQKAGFFDNTLTQNSSGARRFDVLTEVLALLDHSLEVSVGVNYGLFAATVRRIGSVEQYEHWLPRIERGLDFGCFALTELGHGSNVRGIETVATYDIGRKEFVIHTPGETAQKYWIGGSAERANVSVVFAQLRIQEKEYGIHVFVVPLRGKDGKLMPGVQIADCGHKPGLNGVDNGRIWFTHVRVPRENMLCGMSQVAPSGRYSSKYATPDVRFGAQLAALTGGRVGIAVVSVACAMLGLTIAIRYSLMRRAFSPRHGAEEVPLLFYTSQQRLLMVPLATAFVYAFCARDLREGYYETIETGVVTKEVHTLSAGYKAMFTWFMQDALQAAREACGGQGYKSENRIAPMKADRDVMMTFEGANGVMLQQVAKVLLAEVGAAAKNGGKFTEDSIAAALNHVPRKGGSSKILDREFIFAAFWRREKALVQELGRRYAQMLLRHKGEAFYAWNECLSLAEATATANMHRRIYEAHERHVKRAYEADAGCGEALTLCGQLWAADVITSDSMFLRHGCISAVQASEVEDNINSLCRRVTDMAEPLLEGIGIPDHLLSPIAINFVQHNSRAKL